MAPSTASSEVGVLEHDERRVAAQLEGGAQDLLRALLEKQPAHRGGTGERQFARQPGANERLHHSASVGRGDAVDDTRGHAGFGQDVHQRQHRQRGLGGRLDHAGAARGDGRPQLAGAHRHRKVPWCDQQARADGLTGHQEARPSGRRRLIPAVDTDGLARKVAEKLCGISDFATGLGQWLAHLQRHQQRKVVDPLVQQLERPGQHVGPVPWRCRGEGGLGGDGRVERGPAVGGRRVGHRAQRLAGRGVDDIDRPPVRRSHPLAVDEQPLLDGIDNPRLVLRVHGNRSSLLSSSEFCCVAARTVLAAAGGCSPVDRCASCAAGGPELPCLPTVVAVMIRPGRWCARHGPLSEVGSFRPSPERQFETTSADHGIRDGVTVAASEVCYRHPGSHHRQISPRQHCSLPRTITHFR